MYGLENMREGDYVIVTRVKGSDSVSKVERTTKTQIIVGGLHYLKSNGYIVGRNEWNNEMIFPATEDDVRNYKINQRREEIIAHLKGIDWDKYPLESLELFVEVIKVETRQ